MGFYLLLSRHVIGRSYLGKIMLVAFLGVHMPLIGLVLYLLTSSAMPTAEVLPIVLVMLGATVLGTGLTLAGLYALLAPVRQASAAIRDYLRTRRAPSLPTRLPDEAGRLLADVQEGITRLDTAIDAAEAARRRAEEDRRSDLRLLSGMSHELRTPLNAIIGLSEMMQHEMLGPLGASAYRGYAAEIGRSGAGLLGLVQGVIDLSRASAGGDDTGASETVAVAPALAATLALKHLHAEQLSVRLIESLPSRLPPARVDPRALKQVLLHLVSGLLQATPAGGAVRAGASVEADGRVVLRFAADGGGYVGEDLPELLHDCWNGETPPPTVAGFDRTSVLGFALSVIRALAIGNGIGLRLSTAATGRRIVELALPVADVPPVAARSAA